MSYMRMAHSHHADTFLGYPVDIQPDKKDMDSICAEFGADCGVPFAQLYWIEEDTEPAHIRTYKGSGISSLFGDISKYTKQEGNQAYIEREVLRSVLCQVHGIDYVPDEPYPSFIERLEPHKYTSWKYTG